MGFHDRLSQKLITREKLEKQLNFWRFKNRKIVFTNGCFDILHAGHVDYLAKARDMGNALVLGLNTDASVKRQNKSPERPVNNEQARAMVLAGLESVDAIILFDEDTPYELIRLVQPDVLVKGDDYKPEDIVGYDIVKAKGGVTVTVPLLAGFSTTALIDKLKK